MYETIRIVEKLKPKYVIWENVKNLLSKNHRHNFDAYLETMEQLGYTNYYEVLNAKDYGIPQNRERVFTVSILGNENYKFPKGKINNKKIARLFNFSARQDCRVVYDKEGLCPTLVAGMGAGGGKVPMFIETNFEFPPKQELKLKLKDILEEQVDEKYYLRDDMVNKIKASNFAQEKMRTHWKDPKYVQLGTLDIKGHECIKRVYSQEGLSPTLTDMQSGNRQPKVIIGSTQNHSAISTNGIVPTLTSAMGQGGGHVPMHNYGVRIRKLTPKECWRLMGFDDTDFEKAEKVNSNTQLYKQARKLNCSKCARSYIKEFIRGIKWIQVIYYFQNPKIRKSNLLK